MSIVSYKAPTSVVSGRPSPSIWADCPVISFLKDPGKGFHVFDDFVDGGMLPATTAVGHRWYTFIDTNGTLTLEDDEKGVLRIMTDEDDNDALVLTTGHNTTGCITPASESDKKWWFEARIKCATITDGDVALFVGLTEEGQAADSKPLADDGTHAVGDIDHVGFHVSGADGDGVNFVWNLSGQTAQETADVHTLEVDTWVNLGFKYEPGDNKVHVFVDGVENKDAAFLMSHASAPDDCLAVCLAIKADGTCATDDYLYVDWVRYASEY